MASTTVPATGAARAPSPQRILAILGGVYALCFVLMAVQVNRAFGLPAHPLLIHVPVILDPLLCLAAIVLLIHEPWRRRYGLALGALAVVALAGTVLAVGAGDKFFDQRPFADQTLRDHKEAGETLRLLMFVFVALLLAVLARDTLAPNLGGRAVAVAAMVVGIALAGATGFFTVRTGHLGAKAVWERDGGGPPAGGFPGGGPGGGQLQPPAAGQPPASPTP